MPSALPYYRHFTGDYTRETRHFSTLEHGAYRLLMDAYWDNGGPLPLDPTRLRRITGTTKHQWAAIEATIFSQFFQKNGMLFHKKLDEELLWASDRVESARAKGQASGASRRGTRPRTTVEPQLNYSSSGFELEANSSESESDSSSSFHSEEEHGVLAKPKKPTVSESHTAAFEEFWKLYPKSIDRSASLKAWMRNVKPSDVPEVMRALKLYVARMAGKEIQFVKRGATFVNSGWREELALAAKAPVVGAIQRPLITEEPPTPPDLLEIRQKRYAAVEARAAELRAEAEASQK